MIERFYKTSLTIYRQSWSGESSVLVEESSFNGHLQQGTPKNFQQDLGFRFSKAFTVWCSYATDILEGDRLNEGSNTYDVRFVIDRNIGNNGHKEVIIEKSDE